MAVLHVLRQPMKVTSDFDNNNDDLTMARTLPCKGGRVKEEEEPGQRKAFVHIRVGPGPEWPLLFCIFLG